MAMSESALESRILPVLLSGLALVAACNGGGSAGAAPDAAGTAADGSEPNPATGATDPAVMMIEAQIAALQVDKSSASWRTTLPRPAVAMFTAGRSYLWVLSTSKGELRLKLEPQVAPMHVTSTIYLTLLGFYDTLTFHRIVKGWVAQGGDPTGSGSGTPGYQYALETSPTFKHDARGVLSMANAGPNTDGSQFFITFGAAPALDGKFSAFGRLIGGLDTLAAIEQTGTVGEGTPGLVTIDRARIVVE